VTVIVVAVGERESMIVTPQSSANASSRALGLLVVVVVVV